MRKINTLTITLLLFFGMALGASAQVSVPVGNTTAPASQLAIWFNVDEIEDTWLQIVNTSNDSAVTVHVQIWGATDGSGNPVTDPCLEINFTDVLTPNDTHVYELDSSNNLILNSDPCTISGGSCSFPIDIGSAGFSEGFVTVTPVISTTDKRAIAFNHLAGNVQYDDSSGQGRTRVMTRLARSFITGDELPDGTVLDGVTGGLELLQPDVLKFNFDGLPLAQGSDSNEWIIAFIATVIFSDNYSGPFGDYRSQPASASFNTLLFNDAEVPTSCQPLTATCVLDVGINDAVPAATDGTPSFIDPFFAGNPNAALICPGNTVRRGWLRNTVFGFGADTNIFGVTVIRMGNNGMYVRNMLAEGEEVVPTPEPTPTPTATPTSTPDGSPTPTGGGTPNGGGGGGSSGCAIVGPVQASTAAANALIVLLPAVFFGLRRKFRKS